MNDIPIEKQIACAKRELGMREYVYQRRVADDKMTQAKADDEIATMRAVLETLETVRATSAPKLL